MTRKGFTLIEVIAAIVIVGVGLVSVIETFLMGNKMITLREERTVVAHLLQGTMEEVKAKGYAADVSHSGECSELSACAESCARMLTENCKYTIKKEDYDAGLQLKKIDLAISWEPRGWEPQEEKITTVITNR